MSILMRSMPRHLSCARKCCRSDRLSFRNHASSTSLRCSRTFTTAHTPRLSTAAQRRRRSNQYRAPLPQISTIRRYHSPSEPEPPHYTPAEEAILAAALARVPTHSFTLDALILGATDAGYLPASTNLFPRGAFDLLLYHLVRARLALKHTVQFPTPREASQVRANIETLVRERLRANAPIAEHLPQALGLISLPQHVGASLAELARLADEILYLAGDTSVDSSWYTKRAGLSATYAAAELYMTRDTSVDYKETGEFVARRLDEMQAVSGAMGDFGEWARFSEMGAVNVLRSWGVRI